MSQHDPSLTEPGAWQTERAAYQAQGMCVIRNAVPPDLLNELRLAAEHAASLARRQYGPQAQRLPNVFAVREVNPEPFRAFLNLSILQECVAAVLSPEHQPSKVMSLLVNPQDMHWLMPWHRDWVHNANDVDHDEWLSAAQDLSMFSQINAPLYNDHCLWWVPGSHARASSNLEVAARRQAITVAHAGASWHSLAQACTAMPNGRAVKLGAGDIALYRNSAWHAGLYGSQPKRATIHTWFEGHADRAWHQHRRDLGVDVNQRDS